MFNNDRSETTQPLASRVNGGPVPEPQARKYTLLQRVLREAGIGIDSSKSGIAPRAGGHHARRLN